METWVVCSIVALLLPLIAAAALVAAINTGPGRDILRSLEVSLPQWAAAQHTNAAPRFAWIRQPLGAAILKLKTATSTISHSPSRAAVQTAIYAYGLILIAAVFMLLAAILAQHQRELAIWELLIAPLLAGVLLAVFGPSRLIDWVNAKGDNLLGAYDWHRTQQGAFSKWAMRPALYLYSHLHIRLERSPCSAEWKAGWRVSAILYIAALAILTVAAIVGAILVVVLVIAIFVIAGWVIKFALDQNGDNGPPKSKPAPAGFLGRAGRTRLREGVFGPYQEQTDERGKVIGTSRVREGIFGQYVEHRDSRGNKVGESRDREGVFSDYGEHTDKRGNRTGETRHREGIFGPYEEHTDSRGNVTGESRSRDGLFGPHTEHTKKD